MPLSLSRLQAEASAKEYTRRNARRYTIALMGDGTGNVEVSGRDKWVWVRIEADDAQLTQAKEKGSVAHVEDLVVIVERVLSQGATSYQVIGIAPVPDYPNNTFDGSVGAHATQHQRLNFGQGGFDPLDIWTRMQVELRARQQSTANMTVYVEAGKYIMNSAEVVWAGGNSPTVTAPAVGYSRCDLLYLNASNALAFVTGTPTVVSLFTNAPKPTAPTTGYFPIAYIYTQAGQTTITESSIEDARINFLSAGTGALPPLTSAHILVGNVSNIATDVAMSGDVTINNSGVTVVADDSHAHTAATLPTLGAVHIVDTEANILATNEAAGVTAYSTDTLFYFISLGSTTWVRSAFPMIVEPANPDMGVYQDSSRIGYGTNYIDSKALTRVTVGYEGMSSAGGLRITGASPNQYFQCFINGVWVNFVTGFTLRENAMTGIMEHYPTGKTVWLSVAQEDSLDLLGLNGLPIVQGGVVSMGAYPVHQVLNGGTF